LGQEAYPSKPLPCQVLGVTVKLITVPCLMMTTGTVWPMLDWASEANLWSKFSPASTLPNFKIWSPSCKPSSTAGDASAISSTTAKGLLTKTSTSIELGERLTRTFCDGVDATVSAVDEVCMSEPSSLS